MVSPSNRILQVTIKLAEEWHELLIAELAEQGFESFEQIGEVLRGYLPEASWSDELESYLRDWLVKHCEASQVDTLIIPARNWNELWESTIQPVFVPPFIIKPSWAEVEAADDKIVIEIDPKMSFGTGYHESTRIALRLIQDQVGNGDRILDAGTGTGVLAVAAVKLGASSVFAFDDDPWSYENATENVELNGVGGTVTVELGTLADVPRDRFDMIVANIQLSVIRKMMPGFVERLADRGRIVVSGLLESDRNAVREMARHHRLRVQKEVFEGEWYGTTLVA